ncbi:hypothetical protein ES703_68324 [subsurface metagenome]
MIAREKIEIFKTLGFVGGGQMAEALIKGLLSRELTTGLISSRTIAITWGLTARTIISDPLTTSLFSKVVFIPNVFLR